MSEPTNYKYFVDSNINFFYKQLTYAKDFHTEYQIMQKKNKTRK